MTTAFEHAYQGGLQRARQVSGELAGPSWVERWARLPVEQREAVVAALPVLDLARLNRSWGAWARPKQDPDLSGVEHRGVFFMGGRGSGKTLSGAQRIRRRVEAGARSIVIIGPTLRDVERYMITGEGGADGILTVFHPSQRPEYLAHKAMIRFHTGAICYVNSGEDPEFRGSNLDTAWIDEPAKVRYLETLMRNVELATRLRGPVPLEIIMTGTPLPLRFLREFIADPDNVTILLPQSENTALDASYRRRMQERFGATRLGRQELEGEILLDNPDSLFQSSILDASRVEDHPPLVRVGIAVDPAQATGRYNDETGIIVGGRDATGEIYITGDLSMRAKPEAWGAAVAKAFVQLDATAVVAERNRGGDMVPHVIRSSLERLRGLTAARAMPIVEVYATRGKLVRAEPASALCEQGMIHMVGRLPELESELCEYNPNAGGPSPNRYDAFVWLVHYLADLGKDVRPDYREGFRGLKEAAERLSQGASAQAARFQIAAALSSAGRGRTL